VYEDRDAGGRGLRRGDAGLNGWRVWLDRDRDARYDRGEPATTTRTVGGRAGTYSLRTRARGTALIRSAPAGSVASRWRSSARRCTEPSSCRWSVRLGRGSSVRGKDFGWYQTATISGSVYEDEDGDGLRDAPEFGLSGWRVWLDRDRDGVFDPGEPSDVTAGAAGPAGVYSIAGVKPSAAAAPLRHAEVEPVGTNWRCTQPVTTDQHGCFTELRPRSGDRLERDLGDQATEPVTPPPAPPGPQPPAAAVGGLLIAVVVVSDDGGSLAEVTLRVLQGGLDIEGSPRPSSTQGGDFTLAPGTYTVDVAGAAGYAKSAAGDCDASGKVVINAGFTSSCTITVNDIAPTIKVITDVVNDNGLSLGAGSFTSRVRTTGPFPADVPGSPMQASATGVTFTVRANKDSYPYEVYEDDPAPLHYLRTKITGDCDSLGRISLAVGEHKTCRITNDDIKAPTDPLIEGNWLITPKNLSPWQVTIQQQPPYTFQGKVTSAAQCPNVVDQTILRDFHGTGPTYEGFFRLYNSGNCADSNEYPATITRSDATHATVCAHFTGGVPDICQPMVRP
jgi:hypothetical protein